MQIIRTVQTGTFTYLYIQTGIFTQRDVHEHTGDIQTFLFQCTHSQMFTHTNIYTIHSVTHISTLILRNSTFI